MVSEAELYPVVERWVKRHFGCWQTGTNTGPRVGRIDVAGVRDIGGDLSGRSEVIAVEVKAGRQVFATSAGQAHGYSVMADRCYLADLRSGATPFSEDEILIASRLRVGLAAIRGSGRIDEVLTAPVNEPIEELRLQVVEKLGLALCALCGILFRRGTSAYDWSGVIKSGQRSRLSTAAAKSKGYMWWLHTAAAERDRKKRDLVYWRRYLCSDCAQELGARN